MLLSGDLGYQYISECFKTYFGGNRILIAVFVLFAASVIYLLVCGEKRERLIFVCPNLILLLTIFNPFLMTKVISLLHMEERYYRFFWTILMGVTICYVGIQLLEKLQIRWRIIILAAVAVLVIAGHSHMISTTLPMSHNLYKIDGSVMYYADLIEEDKGDANQEVTAIFDMNFMYNVKSYDASINSLFGREEMMNCYSLSAEDEAFATALRTGDYKTILYYVYFTGASVDSEVIQQAMGACGVNYVIVSADNQAASDSFLAAGCQEIPGNGYYHLLKWENTASAISLNIETVTVEIPNLTQEVNFLWISDSHIVVNDEYVNKADQENVTAREGNFTNSEGMSSSENWLELCSWANQTDADAVLLGADLVDFASPSTMSVLSEGLDSLNKPFLYVRADHDLSPYWCDESVSDADMAALHSDIDGNEDIMYMEYPEFLVIGWNNSTAQMSEEQLEQMKKLFALGKPVILVTHVPIASLVDESLSTASKEAWQDRALLWGTGCYYEPDENTAAFLNMIYDDNTPVVEILSGHLHLTWDGQVTDNVHEHVFSAAAYDNVGEIHVVSTAE